MTDLGFKQGKASPCVLWHRQRDAKALVHGDDFVSSGERKEREKQVRDEDDHGGEGRRLGQGGESAEPNREMAPAKRDYVPGRSQARGNNQSRYRSGEAQHHLNASCIRNRARSRGGEETRSERGQAEWQAVEQDKRRQQ